MSESTNQTNQPTQPSKPAERNTRWMDFILRVCEMVIAILTSLGISSCTNLLH